MAEEAVIIDIKIDSDDYRRLKRYRIIRRK